MRPEFFTDQTLLALFNTVYLKVHWKHFDKADTQPEAFTLPDGSRADVLMMHADELETDVVLADDYDAVALGTDGPVTVWVIVPKEGRLTADELLNKLDARALEELYARAESSTGSLALPKFTTRYEAQDLNGDLSAMGMPRAFSPDEAEFQGIADVDQLYVSKVVQKTFMELNEQGVEAAAGSGVDDGNGSRPGPRFQHPRRPPVPRGAHREGHERAALHGADPRPAGRVTPQSRWGVNRPGVVYDAFDRLWRRRSPRLPTLSSTVRSGNAARTSSRPPSAST